MGWRAGLLLLQGSPAVNFDPVRLGRFHCMSAEIGMTRVDPVVN